MELPGERHAHQRAQLEAVLRNIATSTGPLSSLVPAQLSDVFPGLVDMQPPNPGPQQDLRIVDAAARVLIFNTMRLVALQLSQEANAQGAPPMWFVPHGASKPALPRLMELALYIGQNGCADGGAAGTAAALVIVLLEDVADASTVRHCPHIFQWLEGAYPSLRSPTFYGTTKLPVLRLCNALLRRLSNQGGDCLLAARILLFTAAFFPLNDRSGVNLNGLINTSHIAPVDALEPGATDSNGEPVDVQLYTTFWKLQALLQRCPPELGISGDAWSRFSSDVAFVLKQLAKRPITVPATSALAAPRGSSDGSGAGADGGDSESEAASVGYLSSHKLFGLQLRDAAFRRAFLVQVLILLHGLCHPSQGDAPKARQAAEAGELADLVYQALEATPEQGARFAAAVRGVMTRETAWAAWKRGLFPAPKPAAAAAEGGKAASAAPVMCPDYAKPPVPPLAAVVASAEREAAAKRQREAENVAAAMEARRFGQVPEWASDEEDGGGLKRRRLRVPPLPKDASALDQWVLRPPPDNLGSLHTGSRKFFPTLELVARRALQQMDPASGKSGASKAIHNPVYRWKLARLMLRRQAESATMEESLMEVRLAALLPDLVPPGWQPPSKESTEPTPPAPAAAGADKARGGGDGGGGARGSTAAGAREAAGTTRVAAEADGEAEEGEAPAADTEVEAGETDAAADANRAGT